MLIPFIAFLVVIILVIRFVVLAAKKKKHHDDLGDDRAGTYNHESYNRET